MGVKEQFGNPRGMVGRLMLSGMNLGHTPMAKWGLAQFEVPEKAEIADIGCGGGQNIHRLLKRVKEGHVYGVDISAASVEKSRQTNRKDLGRRCEIYQGSAEKLPFVNGSLDLVTAFETVYFWPNITDCFRDVRRVLKEGGCFAVVNDPGDPEKHWEDHIPNMTAYTAEEIAELMKQAGFAETKVTTQKYKYCVIGQA